jgi:hypothetical protein
MLGIALSVPNEAQSRVLQGAGLLGRSEQTIANTEVRPHPEMLTSRGLATDIPVAKRN